MARQKSAYHVNWKATKSNTIKNVLNVKKMRQFEPIRRQYQGQRHKRANSDDLISDRSLDLVDEAI